jgi:hypothetical protein
VAYVVETDVNRYGFLCGPETSIPASVTVEHSWLKPFPTVDGRLEMVWERGTSRRQPDVFQHNLLRDFVCDTSTHRLLNGLVRGGLHVVAHGRCEERELVVLQVTTVLDVVDAACSTPAQYGLGALKFPHIPADKEPIVEGTFFRVPDVGLSLTILVADDVKEAVQRTGIRGWQFTRAQIAD